ncbi:gp53-like domain-containing protein [Eikenella corrodens]|uniref:gp53-like domain-containing protein n=1 Tax=Eikenella corrodens TaxID=539 RepID=UPI00129A3210|nr:hypothetical protein [Eikenella corrodens]
MEQVNLGTLPDGTGGDSIRVGFQKCNDNFLEVAEQLKTAGGTSAEELKQIKDAATALEERVAQLEKAGGGGGGVPAGELAALKQQLQQLQTKLTAAVQAAGVAASQAEDAAHVAGAAQQTATSAQQAAGSATQTANAAKQEAAAAKQAADGKAPASHTHTAAQISDWDTALEQTVSQAVAGAFPVQKADNGYLKLPNGLILQWGKVASGWPGEGPYTVTFPVAFPNKCLNTQVTMWSDGRKGSVLLDITIPVGTLKPTGFDAMFNAMAFQGASAADLKGFYWFAIGY